MNSKLTCVIRCLALLVLPSAGFAQTAQLQPPQVYEGDITTLVVEYVNKIPSLYAIDTSELARDFVVLGLDSRVHRIKEAGETSNRMQWKIQLSPRRAGNLVIPSLKLGGKTTPKLTLKVQPLPVRLQQDENVMVKIEASPENPYRHQQTDITLRLMHNIAVTDGQLYEPKAENVTIMRSGDETSYRGRIHGDSYNIVDRSIALFANEAGELELSPANFRGSIASASVLSSQRLINRYSTSLNLQVRKPPAEFSGQHWLPARQIELSQQWQTEKDELLVGDSISRQLKIVATGIIAEVLPEDLLLEDSDRFKVYADQAERRNQFVGKFLVGEVSQQFEIVLAKPGVVELPEMHLKWWDVDEDIEKQAFLPGRTIHVTSAKSTIETRSGNASIFVETELITRYLFYPISVIMLLVTAGWFFSGNRRGAKMLLRYRQKRALKKACLSQDAGSARSRLLCWANIQWPEETTVGLHQIAARLNIAELSSELERLDRAIYSSSASEWRGNRLYRLLIQCMKRLQCKSVSDWERLPDLYPQ